MKTVIKLGIMLLLGFMHSMQASAEFGKARYVGKPSCANGGFFDPRNGGECWSCPENSSRSVFPVNQNKACEIPAKSTFKKATFLGKKTSPKPDKNAFKDPRNGGEWWKCPDNRPRRTAYEVTGNKACATKEIIGEKLAKAIFIARVNNPQPKGAFTDPRNGGEYWKCDGGYKRTIHAVTSDKACEKVTSASYVTATFKKKSGCNNGTFFDLRNGGECWSCPSKWYRTVAPVTHARACTDKIGDMLAIDSSKTCRDVVTAISKGGEEFEKFTGGMSDILKPVSKPIDAAINDFSERMQSPKEMEKLAEALAKSMSPYTKELAQMPFFTQDSEITKKKVLDLMLNPDLICSGNKKKILAAINSSGIFPESSRNDSGESIERLFSDLSLIPAAHAASRGYTHMLLYVSAAAANPGGPAATLSFVLDQGINARLLFSFGGAATLTPGVGISVGVLAFPNTVIEDFDGLNVLAVNLALSLGEPYLKKIKEELDDIYEKSGVLFPPTIAFSFSPVSIADPPFSFGIGPEWDVVGKNTPAGEKIAESLKVNGSIGADFTWTLTDFQ